HLSLLVQGNLAQRKHTPPARPVLRTGSAEPAGFSEEASKPPRKTPRILARRPSGLVRRLRRSEGVPNVKSLKSRATATATATSPEPRRAGLDPPYEATVAVSPTRREQEQLAALAPSSGASRHLLPQAGEGQV